MAELGIFHRSSLDRQAAVEEEGRNQVVTSAAIYMELDILVVVGSETGEIDGKPDSLQGRRKIQGRQESRQSDE